MTEIKFRGLSLNGEWYHGLLSIVTRRYHGLPSPGNYISNSAGSPFAYAVRPETVGQYTGLKDKNKKDIYEGDIAISERYPQLRPSVVTWNSLLDFEPFLYYMQEDDFEVIGNKFENPELLKTINN